MRYDLNGRRVLVLKLQGLGDTALQIPFLTGLIREYPRIKLDVAVSRNDSDILLKLYPFKSIRTVFAVSPGIKGYLGFVLKMLLRRYYLIILPYKSGKKENLLSFLSFCPRRAGFVYYRVWKEYYRPLLDFLVNRPLDPDVRRHLTELNTDLLSYLTGKKIQARLEKRPLRLNARAVEAFLRQQRIRPYMVFHLGAGDVNKLWPLESYVRLLRLVLDKYRNVKIVLVGKGYDKELNQAVKEKIGSERIIRYEQYDLNDLLVLLRKASLVMGNDSGVMHLAALVRTKVLSLWGYTDPDHISPAGEGVYIIRKRISCSPCYKVTFSVPCTYEKKRCLYGISVGSVWPVLVNVMEGKKVKGKKLNTGATIVTV
ncbi:MAG: glycosyltransferase family 9 protein [bacterium]|nr:glycosyltransferase family 9 protein [bacterium]